MDNITNKGEPRGNDGRSVKSEYAIEHPLIGKQSLSLDKRQSLGIIFRISKVPAGWRSNRKRRLYTKKRLNADPSLHTHARDALIKYDPKLSP